MSEIKTKATGDIGENTACEYLEKNNYKIVARNVHVSRNELDIIAEKDGFIVFVEVKTRTFPSKYQRPYAYSRPADAVSYKKRINTVNAALGYIRENDIHMRGRFDVIEIYFAEYPDKTYKLHKLNHIENAFDATGNII